MEFTNISGKPGAFADELKLNITSFLSNFNATIHGKKTLYDFTVKDAKGNDVDLSIYKGKVVLIVNVASKCGLTNNNYDELNQIYLKYREKGFEILAFPCNQFGAQEPGTNEEIVDFVCTKFKSEFPIFDKIDVNGENAAPVYEFLKTGFYGILGGDIQWNFSKFLVDKNGIPVDRYYPTTSPLTIEVKRQKYPSKSGHLYILHKLV
ncbi:glutathione peroxidase 1-like [Bidens hawaiensis]|uniref:glutathione peroxidase 1-like n=1 Tax=Bidens hawaiensis TaxID=980011 RepID=UPI00404A55E2